MALQLNDDEVHTPARLSATVMVLRDGLQGLEILMVRRHSNSGVLGGAHVFPGGKLDEQDCLIQPGSLDQPVEALHRRLNEAELDHSTAAGLHVAALRETFEECGLLLHPGLAPEVPGRLTRQLSEGMGFMDAMRALKLPLPTSSLHPWSRWITPRTPSVSNRRFDTRFFAALAPSGQEASHDQHEVTETGWFTPVAALQHYWNNQISLAPAQIMTLSQLARFDSAGAVLQAAAERSPALIEPEPFQLNGERVICYPGDARHSVKERIWAGPTRLTFRNQRFEAEGGLAALLP